MNSPVSRHDVELMAPVGSFESLMAAIQAGADAVYFGLGKLNMRARSSVNFTEADLRKIVRICRNFNTRTYLTLNVVFYGDELEEMRRIIDLAASCQVDAIIAADQAAISYARMTGMEVHLSTQVNISNIESLKFYAGFADVMVLARELNLEQVKEMTLQIVNQQITGPSGRLIRIEMFAHGALCMAISGKCYLSLHNHWHSANRGECLQDCRRSYLVKEKETGFELEVDNQFIMSPKDLCTIHFLNKIIDAGVSVFKIEGRARSPEYVKTVTACYHEALLSIADGSYTGEKIATWQERLAAVFNRGFWDGYYLGQRLGEWSHVYGSKADQYKEYVAKCTNYYPKMAVAEFLCESTSLQKGEEVLIIGPTTGVVELVAPELHGDNGAIEKALAGLRFALAVPRKVRRGDKLYKIVKRKH